MGAGNRTQVLGRKQVLLIAEPSLWSWWGFKVCHWLESRLPLGGPAFSLARPLPSPAVDGRVSVSS